jgi:hypothetical protein
MRLARHRAWHLPEPIHNALQVDRSGGGKVLEMGFLSPPIPRPPHAAGQDSLRDCPLNARTAFVTLLKGLGLLALTSREKGQLLCCGMERQSSRCCLTAGTSSPHATRSTILTMQGHLHGGLPPGAFGRLPVLALFSHGTGHELWIPIHRTGADIIGLLILSLPALILAHRTDEFHLLVLLTLDEFFA